VPEKEAVIERLAAERSVDLDELEAPRDRSPLPGAVEASVLDGVLEVDQHSRNVPLIGFVDQHRLDGEGGIEEVSEADPLRFGRQPEQVPVRLKRPGPTLGLDRELLLILPVEELLAGPAFLVSVSEGEGVDAVPLGVDHTGGAVRQEAPDLQAGDEILELSQSTQF